MTTFADYFSFKDFMKFAKNEMKRDPDINKDDRVRREAYQKMRTEIMAPAVIGFLKQLREDGKLERIANAEGRAFYFLNAWNGWFDNSEDFQEYPDHTFRAIANQFDHRAIFRPVYQGRKDIEAGADPETVWKAAYAQVIETMNKGDFPYWDSSGSITCTRTDEHLALDIEGWKITLGGYDKNYDFVPFSAPAQEIGIVEHAFEVKTGNLLIADWFRIDEFSKAVDDYDGPSINSEKGRIMQALHYAEKHGFLSVSVGNTCPRVFSVDGTLVIGRCDDDEVEDASLGMVCTDLWWATIIERERLVEIVAQSVDSEKAEQLVADYLAEHDLITEVKVEPGTYHLYFDGDRGEFHNKFHSDDLDLGEIEPMFVLSNRKLELSEKPEATRGFGR
jgi:hypothetical protein